MIALLIPVLDRPHRAAVVAASARNSTHGPLSIVFVCTPGDTAQIKACRATGEDVIVTPWDGGRGDYARKINHAARWALDKGATWVFTGADDLRFTVGWDTSALAAAGGRERAVVGTVDNCNPRTRRARHSTHSLVSAAYVELGTIDQSDAVYHDGYWHNFCDDELIQTARSRGMYRPSLAVVEHLHPDRDRTLDDDTYALGRVHFHDDRRLFIHRSNLWAGGRGERTRRRMLRR